MPNMLNLTLPLKRDTASQAKLADIGKGFASDLWPEVSKVLKDSQMVYYARFVLIGTKYLQVLTDGNRHPIQVLPECH